MKTAAQILKAARVEKEIDLNEASDKTKIPLKYLKVIESGQYQLLPGESYARLYIKSYAEFLGLSGKDCVSFFRRDLGVSFPKRLNTRKKQSFVGDVNKSVKGAVEKINLDPNRAKILGLAAIFFSLIGYLFYQYLSFNSPPELKYEVNCQKKGEQFWVVVEGSTDPDSTIIIDSVPVEVDSNGNFSEQLLFLPDRKAINIKAQSPLGQIYETEREVSCQ